MKSNTYTIVRFIAALVTILAIAGQSYIPKKRLLIHPSQTTNITLDGYIDSTYGKTAKWLDEEDYSWVCSAPSTGRAATQGCGVSLSWGVIFNTTTVEASPTPICKDTASDEDGDGWGWENEQSCIVPADKKIIVKTITSTPTCINTNSDPDGDGWGWENEQSCKVVTKTIAKKVLPQKPCTNSQSDIDNDGVGLEYGQTCEVILGNAKPPLCSNNAPEDYNNGWGRENNRLCKIKQNTSIRRKNTDLINANTQAQTTEKDDFQSIDFSRYDHLNLKIHYEGRASHLRVYLRNSDPRYTNLKEHNSAKFMAQTVLSEDLTTGIFQIKLSNFNVAEWWTIDHPLPRQWSGPELNNITSLGVDHITPGLHKVRLDKIELTGEWIKMEQLLLFISIFWFIYLLIETLLRYYSLQKTSERSWQEIDHLTSHTIKLEVERNEFKELSITDALTGIFNREGIAQYADNLFQSNKQNQNTGIMILDIDYFKRVNDTYGHDIGDSILKTVTALISTNIRENDIFGRWGGEEFILICPQTTTQQLMSLGEKLRAVMERHIFDLKLQLEITISIGATGVKENDSFNTAFKRADIALYTAKNERNKVCLQA